MISDALIERYLTGDLPEETKRRIESEAATDATLRARIQAVKDERDAFLLADPPQQFAHRLHTQLAVEADKRVPWWRRPLVPALSAALVVLIGVAALLKLGDREQLSPQSAGERALDDAKETVVAPAAPPAVKETVPREQAERTEEKRSRAEAEPARGKIFVKEKAKANKKARDFDDLSAQSERSGAGSGYAQPPGKGSAKDSAPADDGGIGWREATPKAEPATPAPPSAPPTADKKPAPPMTSVAPSPRDGADAMGGAATADEAPKADAEGLEERRAPKKQATSKSLAPDPDGAAPSLMVMTTSGPRRLSFSSQTVRVQRGKPVKISGQLSRGAFVYVAVISVDADGAVRSLAEGSGVTVTLSSVFRVERDAAIVLLTSSSPIRVAELQVRAAKLQAQALSLKFLPTELQPRYVRIVVEE